MPNSLQQLPLLPLSSFAIRVESSHSQQVAWHAFVSIVRVYLRPSSDAACTPRYLGGIVYLHLISINAIRSFRACSSYDILLLRSLQRCVTDKYQNISAETLAIAVCNKLNIKMGL